MFVTRECLSIIRSGSKQQNRERVSVGLCSGILREEAKQDFSHVFCHSWAGLPCPPAITEILGHLAIPD